MPHRRLPAPGNVDEIQSWSSYWSAGILARTNLRKTRAHCAPSMRAGMPALRSGSKQNRGACSTQTPRRLEKRITFRLEDELRHHLRAPGVVLLVRRCNLTKGRSGRVDCRCTATE